MDIRELKSMDEANSIIKNEKNKVIFLKFSGKWCGPCQVYAKNLAELPEDVWEHLVVLNADVEDTSGVDEEDGIRSIPTTRFYYKGEMCRDQFTGLITKEGIINIVKEIIE